jgi:hypothetical protein
MESLIRVRCITVFRRPFARLKDGTETYIHEYLKRGDLGHMTPVTETQVAREAHLTPQTLHQRVRAAFEETGWDRELDITDLVRRASADYQRRWRELKRENTDYPMPLDRSAAARLGHENRRKKADAALQARRERESAKRQQNPE